MADAYAAAEFRICARCSRDCTDMPKVKDQAGQYYCPSCYEELSTPESAGAAAVGHADGTVDFSTQAYAVAESAAPRPGMPPPPPVHRHLNKALTQNAEDAQAFLRREYTKPAIMMMISMGVMLTLVSSFAGLGSAGIYLIEYSVNVFAGSVIFWLCTMLWIGVDAPIHLNVLRLAAIDATALLVFIIGSFVLWPLVGWFLFLVTYIGLLAEMLDLEYGDAIIFAILRVLLKLLLTITMLAWLIAN